MRSWEVGVLVFSCLCVRISVLGVLVCVQCMYVGKTHNDKLGALEADRPRHVLPRLAPHQNTASHMLQG